MNTNKLWTRDFTIITVGSIISMLGNSMTGFAMSLMVLDYTSSSILYAIYIAVYTLPQLIAPIVSGAVLDRFSRKKTIYILDFVSAGMFILVALILSTGYFNFAFFALFCFLLGSINSMYLVAYDSFYPLLITEGNYQKAYSISSVLETMSFVMVPVATFVYNLVGIVPLLVINAVSFFIAAVLETQIQHEEEYVARRVISDEHKVSVIFSDIKEGFLYLKSERGLLAVATFFMFLSLSGGATQVLTLPYFKSNFENGEYIYMLVFGWTIVGRALGGLIHYKKQLPVNKKYIIAMTVYLLDSVIDATYLFTAIPVMMIMMFAYGMMGVTSYTIRISGTQAYVPDEKKGRFNGAFNVLNTMGALVGQICAGALATLVSQRYVIAAFALINSIAAIVIIGGNKKEVSKIYNVQQ